MEKQVMKLKVAIKSFGCQMNVYDSEVARGFLSDAGFEIYSESEESLPAPSAAQGGGGEENADVILMNTCSVREHAEERVYGRLGMLGKVKKTKPDLIVGLMGCMVEEHREKLFKRFPQLDFMIGTRNIKELPGLIEEVRKNRRQVAQIRQDGLSIEYSDLAKRSSPHQAWLPIMTGCDKVCTFCIVPITRGAEVSMPAREVYREASRLAADGVKWVTLLGQNVNSYRGNPSARAASFEGAGDGGKVLIADGKGEITFPRLLEMLCEIEGLKRISFTTSHPHDATEDLFQVIRRNPKISRRFHLPLQSGSDRILKRMKRLHTYDEYLASIRRLRELVPDISITTDIIAGFSGETEEDHLTTLRAFEEIRYDAAYIYKYSVRPGTPAAKLSDDVPQEIKARRNAELLDLQKKISRENAQKWIGREVTVFAEAVTAKKTGQILGSTVQDKKVVFEGPAGLVGTFQEIRITGLRNDAFSGEIVTAPALL